MMTTTKADKVAATVPFAMHNLADHITTHALPGPVDVDFPGTMVGDNETPAVAILLDRRSVARWLAHLDTATEETVTEHSSLMGSLGSWHEVVGVANSIRVRLSWWVPSTQPVALEVCVGEDGTCGAGVGDRDSIEPGCLHGRNLCAVHRHECSECVDDARQVASEGWSSC